jgi:hypothetical protein
MLRSVDSAPLAAYCQSYARWQSAEAIVYSEGQTVQEPTTNKAGEVVSHKTKRHPATTVAKDGVCGLDPEDDHLHGSNWIKANPTLGVLVKIKELREVVNEAKGRSSQPQWCSSSQARHLDSDRRRLDSDG